MSVDHGIELHFAHPLCFNFMISHGMMIYVITNVSIESGTNYNLYQILPSGYLVFLRMRGFLTIARASSNSSVIVL